MRLRSTITVAALVVAAVMFFPAAVSPAAALGAPDTTPPAGAVGGVRSPASGTLALRVDASDEGSGLASVEASLDGGPPVYVRLGAGSCPEHPAPGSEAPAGAECPESVSGVPISLDTRAVADGERLLRVTVTDGAGNTATLLDEEIVVRNAAPSGGGLVATVTVGVGGEGPGAGNKGNGNGSGNGEGGVLGSSSGAGACLSPQLTMKLASKPLRYVKVKKRRVPLLRARRNYVYRGKLTCLLNGRRVSARIGTVLHVFYRIGRHPAKRSGRGTMTVHKATRKGNLTAILGYSYTSSRTILFRYDPSKSVLVQVKIPIRIAHGHSLRRGHSKKKRGLGR